MRMPYLQHPARFSTLGTRPHSAPLLSARFGTLRPVSPARTKAADGQHDGGSVRRTVRPPKGLAVGALGECTVSPFFDPSVGLSILVWSVCLASLWSELFSGRQLELGREDSCGGEESKGNSYCLQFPYNSSGVEQRKSQAEPMWRRTDAWKERRQIHTVEQFSNSYDSFCIIRWRSVSLWTRQSYFGATFRYRFRTDISMRRTISNSGLKQEPMLDW